MKVLQLHYTSCRRGQSSGSGFQIFALSDGIAETEKPDIIARGNYGPPHDLNREPDLEEAQHVFPRAFRFYRTQTGRWALTLSCYVGRDFDRVRFGNFFAHTLLFESGLPETYPVDYYDWPGWRTYLDPDKAPVDKPPPLEIAELNDQPSSPAFSTSALSEFMSENPIRGEWLPAMIQAVLLKQSTNRALVIRDESRNGIFWIACLQKIFPLCLIDQLDFSTYQESSHYCATLNATTSGTDFLFNETESGYQYYMFDFDKEAHSKVDVASAGFARLASRWLIREPHHLEHFHRFAAAFAGYTLTEDHLARLATLYGIRAGQVRLAELGPAQVNALLEFMGDFYSGCDPTTARVLLSACVTSGLSAFDGTQLDGLFQFAMEAAATGEEDDDRLFVFNLWLDLMKRSVGEGASRQLAHIPELYAKLLPPSGAGAPALADLLVNSSFVSDIADRWATLPSGFQSFCLQTLISSLEALGRRPFWCQDEFRELSGAMLANPNLSVDEIVSLFRLSDGSDQSIERLCALVADGAADLPGSAHRQEQVGRAFGSFMAGFEEGRKEGIRKRLYESGGKDILLGEWRYLLDTAASKETLYKEYGWRVLKKMEGFAKECQADVDQLFFRSLNSHEQRKAASIWLIQGKAHELPLSLTDEVLRHANAGVSLDPNDSRSQQISRMLRKAADDLSVELSPDRPFVRSAMSDLARSEVELSRIDLEELRSHLGGLSEQEYDYFLKVTLRPALTRTTDPRQHRRVIEALFLEEWLRYGMTQYRAFLNDAANERSLVHFQTAVKAWLLINTEEGEEYQYLHGCKQDVLSAAAKRLRKLNERMRRRIQENFTNDKDADDQYRHRCLDFFRQVEDSKSSFGGILKGIFQKKTRT